LFWRRCAGVLSARARQGINEPNFVIAELVTLESSQPLIPPAFTRVR
jgi:hypothetical protein